jgi:hypothetical protein
MTRILIRGIENAEMYEVKPVNTRKVMSLHLLKLLGHQIADSDWLVSSKQVVWTAMTVAFFGSLRMGEILPVDEKGFCPEDTFLWSDVKFDNGKGILLHIKVPKSKSKEGDFVDIFPFPGHGCCPVAALKAWRKMSVGGNSEPVFNFVNGGCLTQYKFNLVIKTLLRPLIGDMADHLSGHSFRAGIPATVAKFPGVGREKDIMGWGRWDSMAYRSYTRLKLHQKEVIFKSIASILNL